jgi:hypothetical protein
MAHQGGVRLVMLAAAHLEKFILSYHPRSGSFIFTFLITIVAGLFFAPFAVLYVLQVAGIV